MTLEKEIEGKLVAMIKRHGGRCLKWVCPGWAGVPDRILLLPGGRILFAETKRPAAYVIGARQEWWHGELLRLGFESYYIYSATDIKELDLLLTQREEREKKNET